MTMLQKESPSVQVVYSSLTGCTRRLAEAIYNGLAAEKKSIHDLADGVPALDADILLLGYWGVSGGPCEEVQAFLQNIEGKAVGVFCTLGYYADSAHAFDTVRKGVDLLKDRNEIIGSYVCNGAVSRTLKAGQGLDAPHAPTEQKELRWEMTDSHPTPAECALAAERMNERIHLYVRCKALGIPFQSIL